MRSLLFVLIDCVIVNILIKIGVDILAKYSTLADNRE